MVTAYWKNRAQQERAWINHNLKNDAKFNQQLQGYYDRAIADINKTIDAEYDKFQDPETARKAVSQMDVQQYQNTAKEIVSKAEQMRKDGKLVTYGDFSDEVNARLKVYNATMRINRLENIKSQIGAEMLSANLDVQSAISDKLTDDYQAEIKRQAGIMGETTEGKLWTSKQVAKVVMTQTAGADFSKRIWANQDALKAELDGIISTGIIRGESPRKMATRLKAQIKDSVTNHKYVTERIARTESARVQYTAQIDSIKKNGYQFVQWFAEPKACATCRAIARKDNGYGEGIYKIDKVPLIPDDTHPNCRCSISETWVDGEQNLVLTDDELWAMNRYVSSNSYELNEALRLGLSLNDEQKKEIKGIDGALQKLPLYTSDQPLSRSFTNANNYEGLQDLVNNIIEEGYYTDPAYVSSSKTIYDPKDVFRIIILDSKSGRDIASIRGDEGEILFPRNTVFKVVKYYYGKDGTPTIEVVEDGKK